MWLIVGLVIIGALMFVAELVLIPGLSVAGLCALASNVAAVWIAFARFGNMWGYIVLGVVIVISVVVAVLSLRAKTWQRFSLKNNIEGQSQQMPQQSDIAVGDTGMAITRLAPMGKVSIKGHTFEAKSIDAYVDQNTPIEVVDFENFNVVVKKQI